MKKRLLPWALALLCVVSALVARRHASPPFAWAFLLFGVACMCAASAFRSGPAQYAGISLLSICLALSAGEFYLSVSLPAPATGTGENSKTYTEDGRSVRWTHETPITGYGPKRPAHVRARFVKDGNVIYDVLYTINAAGRRVTPEQPAAPNLVAFFGCSYTFGEGLNDGETFAWKTAEALGPRYQVVNFGFSGYGPHQFLAQLQAGELRKDAVGKQKTHVFFLSLAGHELRSAGYSEWDHNGPWYEVENGRAVYKGTFKDRTGHVRAALDNFFRKSRVYTLLFHSAQKSDQNPRILQAAILREAAEEVAATPDADLTILLWPGNERTAEDLAGIPARIVPLAPFLPGYAQDSSRYTIAHEGHPNAYSDTLVAAEIVRLIKQMDQ